VDSRPRAPLVVAARPDSPDTSPIPRARATPFLLSFALRGASGTVNIYSRAASGLGRARLPPEGGFAWRDAALEQSIELRIGFGSRTAGRTAARAVSELSDDARMVAAARDGDREAFGRLYHRYARMVHGVLLAHAPHQEVADLVHDVFLQALRRLASLRDPAAFPGWLAMIARNRARDHFRRARPQEALPDDDAAPENAVAGANFSSPAASPSAAYEARAALEAIQSLPEAYRETLVLRLVEGMTGEEIAQRTGLSPASVRVNLHRGMKQLREKLGM